MFHLHKIERGDPEEDQLDYLLNTCGYSPAAANAFMLFSGMGANPTSLKAWHDLALERTICPGMVANIVHSMDCAYTGCSNMVEHWGFLQDRLQLYHELQVRGMDVKPRADWLPTWRT